MDGLQKDARKLLNEISKSANILPLVAIVKTTPRRQT